MDNLGIGWDMKNVLFILKNPNEGSSRFRVKAFLDNRRWNSRFDIFYSEVHVSGLKKTFRSLIKRVRYIGLLFLVRKYDVIYMQRPMTSDKSKSVFFERLIAAVNPNVVFDFDDALFLVNEQKISALVRLANRVVCGNRYLAAYAKRFNDNVYVIPTVVDTDMFVPAPKRSATVTIGWTGTSGNYKFFSQRLISDIKRILSAHEGKVDFLFICNNPPPVEFDFAYQFIKWNEATEVEDLQRLDIGLMPLDNSDWSRGKCGFKLIQYGAIGIPAIGSNVGVNGDIIQNEETGYLVEPENENWYELIDKLVVDELTRKRMGASAREYIVERYSIKSQFDNFVRVINA